MPGEQPCVRCYLDNSYGHARFDSACFGPRPVKSNFSPDVLINNYNATFIGSWYPDHYCYLGDQWAWHDGRASAGSPTVFVNNRKIHRRGDAISCGDTANSGCIDVRAGH